MQKIFAMYSLKPEVKIEEFREWSLNVDQKAVSSQPDCSSFEVYEIKGGEADEVPYKIVEVIEVASWEKWQEILDRKEMEKVSRGFENYVDLDSLTIIYGEKIT